MLFTNAELTKNQKFIREWLLAFWNSLAERVKSAFSEIDMARTLEILESIITLDSPRHGHLRRQNRQSHAHRHRHHHPHYQNTQHKRKKLRKARAASDKESAPRRMTQRTDYLQAQNHTCRSVYREYTQRYFYPQIKDISSCEYEMNVRHSPWKIKLISIGELTSHALH